MIRDPSDGTVREAPKANLQGKLAGSNPDTGLRQPTRTDAQERLEKWRQWLKDYHAKKEREHAERGSDEERSTDRDSGHDQGDAESGIPNLDGANHGTHREG